jgi:hypothetical protein
MDLRWISALSIYPPFLIAGVTAFLLYVLLFLFQTATVLEVHV